MSDVRLLFHTLLQVVGTAAQCVHEAHYFYHWFYHKAKLCIYVSAACLCIFNSGK